MNNMGGNGESGERPVVRVPWCSEDTAHILPCFEADLGKAELFLSFIEEVGGKPALEPQPHFEVPLGGLLPFRELASAAGLQVLMCPVVFAMARRGRSREAQAGAFDSKAG